MTFLKIQIEIPNEASDALNEIQSEFKKLISRLSDKHMIHMDDYYTMEAVSSMKSIQLDFYYDGPRPESTEKVKIELLKEEGPGGGNPLYKLTGYISDLREYLMDIKYASDDLEFYLK